MNKINTSPPYINTLTDTQYDSIMGNINIIRTNVPGYDSDRNKDGTLNQSFNTYALFIHDYFNTNFNLGLEKLQLIAALTDNNGRYPANSNINDTKYYPLIGPPGGLDIFTWSASFTNYTSPIDNQNYTRPSLKIGFNTGRRSLLDENYSVYE